MKHVLLTITLSSAALLGYSQSDTTSTQGSDTIRIGSMTIVKKPGSSSSSTTESSGSNNYNYYWNKNRKPRRIETTWLNMDFGFSNFVDKTDYTTAEAQNYARATRPGEPAFTGSDFNLRTGKSTNFNLWFFRQKFAFSKDRKWRLTYGLMLETNNYRFDTELKTSYEKDIQPYVWRDSVRFSKNKLATDYFAIPLMIGFDTKPGKGGFTASVGGQIGYLYNSRNKQISDERGKQKTKGNFDLETWKFQYIGEIGFGPVKIYASFTPQTIYERGLDHRPYNVGIRFGDWY